VTAQQSQRQCEAHWQTRDKSGNAITVGRCYPDACPGNHETRGHAAHSVTFLAFLVLYDVRWKCSCPIIPQAGRSWVRDPLR
jgi:hypothetical protein